MKLSTTMLKRKRIRARIHGTSARPRLHVHVSNQHITAQLINDDAGKTLGQATSNGQKTLVKKTMTEKAEWVGETIADAAKKAKVDMVVFDRGTHIYHGRIKALASKAREKGLKF